MTYELRKEEKQRCALQVFYSENTDSRYSVAENMVDLGIWEQVEQRISKIKNCQMDVFIYLAPTSFCFCLSLSPRFLLLYFDFNKTCFSVPLSFDHSPGFNIYIFLPRVAFLSMQPQFLPRLPDWDGESVNIR